MNQADFKAKLKLTWKGEMVCCGLAACGCGAAKLKVENVEPKTINQCLLFFSSMEDIA